MCVCDVGVGVSVEFEKLCTVTRRVVSHSTIHNFNLEYPIPTNQTFFCSLQWDLSHGKPAQKYFSTQVWPFS